MSYYKVDHCDLSCYGDYQVPMLAPEPILTVSAFDDGYAEWLLKILRDKPAYDSGVHDTGTGAKVDYSHRSSKYVNVESEVYEEVKNRLEFVVNFHVEPQINKKIYICEPVQFLRYDSANSGHFSRHTDDGYFTADGFQYVAGHRKFSSITYLNLDYEGGELVLDTVKDPNGLPFVRKLDPGVTVIFPSDQRFPHEVKPVTSGVRFSIVSWFDFV